MDKRVIVTGLGGFIGRNVLLHLQALGFEVVGVGRSSKPEWLDVLVEWHTFDLLEPGSAKKLINLVRPTHLLHFAWYTDHRNYWNSPKSTSWVRSTLELVQEFHESGGKRCVLAGSCAEYDWRYGFLSEYDTPRGHHKPFGRSKNALFEALDAYSEMSGLSFAWGRIFFVYGPYEQKERFVTYLILQLLQGKRASTSHGSQLRDFLHVNDVAAAFAATLNSDIQGPINIASGEPCRLKDMSGLIAEIIGRQDLLDVGKINTPDNEPILIQGDARRMRNELGYVPRITMQEGLEKLISFYRENLSIYLTI